MRAAHASAPRAPASLSLPPPTDRARCWTSAVEETTIEEDVDGLKEIERRREVVVQKSEGQIGICPEVYFPDGTTSGVIKISKARHATTREAKQGKCTFR